jgi:DNA-directed RNA polymerase subunit alpha
VIQRNWQELIKPNKLDVEAGGDPRREALIVAQHLERGFGLTLATRCAASCSRPFRGRR